MNYDTIKENQHNPSGRILHLPCYADDVNANTRQSALYQVHYALSLSVDVSFKML